VELQRLQAQIGNDCTDAQTKHLQAAIEMVAKAFDLIPAVTKVIRETRNGMETASDIEAQFTGADEGVIKEFVQKIETASANLATAKSAFDASVKKVDAMQTSVKDSAGKASTTLAAFLPQPGQGQPGGAPAAPKK
jgi:hypothetical protein